MIYNPPQLKTLVGNNGELVGSLADFGHIPYGHTVVGQPVFIQDNEYGCDDFNTTLTKFPDSNPIVVVKRGKCSFVQKVRNAEHGGAKMAIVVDEINSENVKFITMVNDGTGNGLIIPSILINKDPGNNLIDFISKNDANVTNSIKMIMTFDLNNESNNVKYDILFSSYQDRALDFISDFKEFQLKLGESAKMTPRYFSWPCFTWDADIIKKDCYGNGKYCAMDYTDLEMSGKTILLSNIYQKWIYKVSLDTKKNDSDWWNYMYKAHSSCYKDFTEDCTKMIHNKLGLDWNKTSEWVKNSFVNKDTADEDNIILGEDYEYWNEGGYVYTPAVMINDLKYNGDLVASYVFEAIWASFKDKPAAWIDSSSTTKIGTTPSTHVSFNWFMLVILVLIIFNVILILVCIKRNNSQIKDDVLAVIGKYSKFGKHQKLEENQA